MAARIIKGIALGAVLVVTSGFARAGVEPGTDPVDLFGIYQQGFECGILLAEDGASYQIDRVDGIFPEDGQPVFVSGDLDPECFSFCGLPCIQEATVRATFDGFGTLQQGIECFAFVPRDGGFFVIEPQPGFASGDFVHVRAAIDPECASFCFAPCLENVTVRPTSTFCGRLQQGFECFFFLTDGGGSLQLQNVLDFDFVSGDRVMATGAVDPDCLSFCFIDCFEAATMTDASTDFDCDGATGFTDLLGVLSEWGPCFGCPQDVDGDGAVGFADLLAVLSRWTS